MSDLIKEFSRTGPCALNIEAVLRHDWRVIPGKTTQKICRDTFIQKYINPDQSVTFRFVVVRKFNVNIKVEISMPDALILIDLLGLTGRKNRIFKRGETFRKEWDYIDRAA